MKTQAQRPRVPTATAVWSLEGLRFSLGLLRALSKSRRKDPFALLIFKRRLPRGRRPGLPSIFPSSISSDHLLGPSNASTCPLCDLDWPWREGSSHLPTRMKARWGRFEEDSRPPTLGPCAVLVVVALGSSLPMASGLSRCLVTRAACVSVSRLPPARQRA